jgi:GNAT superfamily N-acetyltransferase
VPTLGFSMEYGGLRGFVDDLCVRPAARGRGAGAALLAAVRAGAEAAGARALLAEGAPDDGPALRPTRAPGFADAGRRLLALPLAAPLHDA